MRPLAVFLLVAAVWLSPPLVPPTHAATCQVAPVFQTLYHDLGKTAGSCSGGEVVRVDGDIVQPVAGGLLAWRKTDSVPAFTNGRQTWLLGPNGLQKRANAARFAWEVSAGAGRALFGPIYTGFSAVAPVAQQHVLSCEASASALALRLEGYHVTEASILAALPIDGRQPVLAKGAVREWGNPNRTFVGRIDGWFPWVSAKADPGTHGWGYGVYAGPLLPVVRSIDPTATGGTGITLSALEYALRQGRPAVVWLPDLAYYHRDRARALRTGQWTDWDGSAVTFAYEEHAQVLLGYDGTHVLVGDVGYRATHGQFLSAWSVADFQAAYAVLHQMAIIL